MRGVPAVAFDNGGTPQWLVDGRTGRLAERGRLDPEALAEAIAWCADSGRLLRLAEAARAHATSWSMERHVIEVENALIRARREHARMTDTRKVLFFVEGFTDIRFVVGLSQISNLTLCVPAVAYGSSGLRERVRDSGATLRVVEIPGSRAQFQARSLRWLWRHAREFDAIVSQEVLRGSVNATLVGRLRGVPVITYMAIAPVEYFRCRRERGQIGWAKALLGEAAIRGMMTFNGRLATRAVALGPYLREIAARYSERTDIGLYYGVDTSLFTPADADERRRLRVKRNLPADAFLIFFASRVSHEKDPETVLRATAIARERGLNAVVLNLGGGYRNSWRWPIRCGLRAPATGSSGGRRRIR